MRTSLYALSTSMILLAGLVLSSWAATITVSGGGSLRQAAQQLKPGDTLLLSAGMYEDGLGCEIPSGSEGAPTIIKAAPGQQAIIRISNGGTGIRLGTGCTQRYIVIDGLRITGEEQASGTAIAVDHEASDITIQNNDLGDILGNGTCAPSNAIGFGRSHRIIIRGNIIHDLGKNDPPQNPTTCNFTYGSYMPTGDNVWENNILRDISAFAIHGYDGGGGSVNNNVVRNNAFCRTGPILLTGSNNTITGNLLYKVGETVYPYERGQTIVTKNDTNTVSNNQIVDSDATCKAGVSAPAPPGPKLPRPKNLRVIQRP